MAALGGEPQADRSTDLTSEPSVDAAPKDIRGQAVKSFGWAAVAFGGNRVVVFVMTLLLARLLVPGDFGLVAAGLTVISYLELGLDLGVSSAVIYEQERGVTPRVQTAFTVNLIVASVFTAIAVLAAPATAAFFRVPDQANLFRALALYLLLRGAGQINDTLLKRDLLFHRRAVVDISRAVVRAAVAVTLAWLGWGVWALAWGFLAGEAVGLVLNWYVVHFRPTFELRWATAKPMLRFGSAVLALKVLSNIGLNSDYLVVGNRLGPTALGFYTIAYRLPELLISNVQWIFSTVAFPVYAKARALGEDAFRRTMLRALALTTLFGFTVGTGLALVSRDALLVFFGAKWDDAVPAMVLISLATGAGALGYASGDIFPAVGRPGTLLAVNAPVTVLQVVGFVVAAPHGIAAVAGVHLGINVAYGVARLALANRLVGSTWLANLAAMRPALCVAGSMAACAIPVRLVTPPGAWSLVAIVAAGSVGAAAGLAMSGRSNVADLVALARDLRSARRS